MQSQSRLTSEQRRFAREFYRRTRHKIFSVNDFRAQKFHELLSHPNATGAFFSTLSREGFIEKAAQTKTLHMVAKGRWVWEWRWTEKAHELWGSEP